MSVLENVFVGLIIFSWATYAGLCIFLRLKNIFWLGLFPLYLHLAWIVFRTVTSGHAPFANAYESLLFFGFLLFLKSFSFTKNFKGPLKAAFILPGIIFLILALLLPEDLKVPGPLAPALQSFWIFVHVPATFYAYVSLTFAFVIKLLETVKKKDYQDLFLNELKQGFFFLSFGIISGAFWAEYSWSVFWSWDAKEVWALVTWLLTGFVFHVKANRAKFVLISLVFVSMLFTYFGVMFILPGLHSYLK